MEMKTTDCHFFSTWFKLYGLKLEGLNCPYSYGRLRYPRQISLVIISQHEVPMEYNKRDLTETTHSLRLKLEIMAGGVR